MLPSFVAVIPDVATSATSFTVAESARDVVVPFCVSPICVGPEGESLPFEQETKVPAKSADAAKRPKILREIFFTIDLQRCFFGENYTKKKGFRQVAKKTLRKVMKFQDINPKQLSENDQKSVITLLEEMKKHIIVNVKP